MAVSKNSRNPKPVKEKRKYLGTKEDMIKGYLGKPKILNFKGYSYKLDIVAEDEKGLYFTNKNNVKSKCLDPYRISEINRQSIIDLEKETCDFMFNPI